MKENTKMKYAIVYSSRTGNTKLLAETIRDALPAQDCIYFGTPDRVALQADRIYVGFWTDKGSCDADTAAFLKTVTNQEIFLFGTSGFGENQEYFDKILKHTGKYISEGVHLVAGFMCQGKMPLSVRERYEKMQKAPVKIPNIQGMIENFDKALSHPDDYDLNALRNAVLFAQ